MTDGAHLGVSANAYKGGIPRLDPKDVLLKAASDVEQGMWCQRSLFRDDNRTPYADPTVPHPRVVLEARPLLQHLIALADEISLDEGFEVAYSERLELLGYDETRHQRCAAGSIMATVAQMGGSPSDYKHVLDLFMNYEYRGETMVNLIEYNDHMTVPTGRELGVHPLVRRPDPFEGGAIIAELFRQRASEL